MAQGGGGSATDLYRVSHRRVKGSAHGTILTRTFPVAYADPRQLDPDAYKFQSKFERYRTLRTYYDRVCARFEAMVDPATWSGADRRHLEELSSHATNSIMEMAQHSRQHWGPSRQITMGEELEASEKCTPPNVAHTCIYSFAIQAFQRYGMDKVAYALIDQGLVAFQPHRDTSIDRSWFGFVATLTSNKKFDRFYPV